MVVLPYLIFLSIFSLDQLAKHGMAPRQVSWVPELLSASAFAMVIIHGALEKRLMITGKYMLLFAFMALVIPCSLIINDVQPGTIFIGVRSYLKYVPFFFLPVVYEYSEQELRRQFLLLMVLGMIQLPAAVLQRFVLYAHLHTGDVVSGTLSRSGPLTVVMVCFVSVVISLYFRQRITLLQLLSLLLIFFIPTAINETKITLVLMPFAVGMPFLFIPHKTHILKKFAPLASVGALLFLIFLGVYQGLYGARYDMKGGSVIDFLTDPARIEHYLYGGAAESDKVGSIDRTPTIMAATETPYEDRVSRIDSIFVAWKVLSGDLLRLLVGVGIGNVTDSYLGTLFSGKYSYYFVQFGAGMTTLTTILWELGLTGVISTFLLLLFLFRDAKSLSGASDLFGVLGQAWTGVICVMVITLPYHNNLAFNSISYLFWFFAGHVVAARTRQIWRRD